VRYRNGEGDKILWIDGAWFDKGSPWATTNAEEVVCNVREVVSKAAKEP